MPSSGESNHNPSADLPGAQVKPLLVLPDPTKPSEGLEVAAHQAVQQIAYERLKHGTSAHKRAR